MICIVIAILIFVLGMWRVPDAIFGWMILVVGLVFASAAIMTGINGHPYEPVGSERIVAVADGSGTSGHFGIFSGVIDETQYYFFYIKRDDGAVVQKKIKVSRAVIIQDSEGGELVKLRDQSRGMNWISWYMSDSDRYEIHVPDGTIVETMKLDLGNN